MDLQDKSEDSFDTISIKLTQNHIPSACTIKGSQDHISLTYTVSLQNIDDLCHSFHYIPVGSNDSIKIQNLTIDQRMENDALISSIDQKSQIKQEVCEIQEKNLFRKKSILKISNIDFSQFVDSIKQQSTYEAKINHQAIRTRRIRGNNSGLFLKTRNSNEKSSLSKKNLKSKELFADFSTKSITQSLLLKTSKFNSSKTDKIIQPTYQKKYSSIKKQILSRNVSLSTDRRTIKFPLVKASNIIGPSMTQRKKAFTTYENLSDSIDRKTMPEKLLIAKTCKMEQNDLKAKVYLQKKILNRSHIMHFTKQTRFLGDFKQNFEELF